MKDPCFLTCRPFRSSPSLSWICPVSTWAQEHPRLVSTKKSHAAVQLSPQLSQEDPRKSDEILTDPASLKVAELIWWLTPSIVNKITEPISIKRIDPIAANVTYPPSTKATDPTPYEVTNPISTKVSAPVPTIVSDSIANKVTYPITTKIAHPLSESCSSCEHWIPLSCFSMHALFCSHAPL